MFARARARMCTVPSNIRALCYIPSLSLSLSVVLCRPRACMFYGSNFCLCILLHTSEFRLHIHRESTPGRQRVWRRRFMKIRCFYCYWRARERARESEKRGLFRRYCNYSHYSFACLRRVARKSFNEPPKCSRNCAPTVIRFREMCQLILFKLLCPRRFL